MTANDGESFADRSLAPISVFLGLRLHSGSGWLLPCRRLSSSRFVRFLCSKKERFRKDRRRLIETTVLPHVGHYKKTQTDSVFWERRHTKGTPRLGNPKKKKKPSEINQSANAHHALQACSDGPTAKPTLCVVAATIARPS